MSVPVDDHEPILDAITTLRRPAWPAAAPTFGDLPAPAAPPAALPAVAMDTGIVRARRWTCELSPDRFRAWRAGGDPRSRTIVVHAIDAEPAVPVQLYWLLSRVEFFRRAVELLSETMRGVATVVVVVPDDVPARWRPSCRALAPRRIDASYPAGNRRLVARAAGVNPRHALVLDVIAAIDLVAGNAARPLARVGEGDAAFLTVHRDATIGELRATRAADEQVDLVLGPRLRARAARDDDAIGDGDVTLHALPRAAAERSPCIRCGWCVAACPTRCDPVQLMHLAVNVGGAARPRALHRAGFDACVDCGLCTAVCPSLLPLHGYIDALRRGRAGPAHEDADRGRPARRLNNVSASLVMLAIVPGILVLGWRASLVVLGIVACASILRRLMSQERLPRPRRWPPTWPLETLLLCALLPAELAAGAGEGGRAIEMRWLIVPSAAILLVLAQRLRQAVPWPAFDPVILAALLLHLALGPMVDPRGALDRGAMIRGDVTAVADGGVPVEPWFERPRAEDAPGLSVPWAARQLDDYLSGRLAPDDLNRGSNLDALIRDKLPPIEDLLLLGHPMPIGTCSGIAIVGLVLWATYRRLIDWRIPLAATLACYVALALLPTPTSVAIEGRNWRAFPAIHVDVGVATGLTFVHYVLLASPALFVFGLVATRGDVRPLHGRAMLVWAVGLGVATAAAMLYVSVIVGPLIAMLPAPLLARWADRSLGRRPLALPD